MPFHDNGLLFLTTSLVIQIYDLEHVFALKCLRKPGALQATTLIFRGKSLSKNKLTCKNAVTRIYCSCTLRVMGSWKTYVARNFLKMWNIAQMLPKVRKSAKGCSKCKIVLQTQESAQKVLSAIGKGLLLGHLRSLLHPKK